MLSESKLEVLEIRLRSGKDSQKFYAYGEKLADVVKLLSEKMGLLAGEKPAAEKPAAPKQRRKRRTKAEMEAAKEKEAQKSEAKDEKSA